MRLLLVPVALVGILALVGCPPKQEAPPAATPAPAAAKPAAATPAPAAEEPTAATPAPAADASAPTPQSNPEAEKAATAVADAWLKLVDERKYDESWTQASELLKKASSQADFAKQVGPTRDMLGKLDSRKVKSTQYATSLPGAPDGEYVVIQYEASFEKKASAIETVTPMKDPDGAWRVSGYFIK
jgi:hypothetical protein